MFKPSNDRVLIKPLEEESKTAGGIIIPDTAQEKPTKGSVIAVGPGINGEKITACKDGDVVLYGKWSGTEVKINGEEYVIVKEADILGVFGK